MQRFVCGKPIIIEPANKAAIREIGFMRREEMKVPDKRLAQANNFSTDPIENLLWQEVDLVFTEIWNPTRIFLLPFCKAVFGNQVTFELIDKRAIQRSGDAIILPKEIFVSSKCAQGILLPETLVV